MVRDGAPHEPQQVEHFGIPAMWRETQERRERDAARFASLDPNKCMMCWTEGPDMRSTAIDNGYAIHEVVPEVIDLYAVQQREFDRPAGFPDFRAGRPGGGYYLLICKTCRALMLSLLADWRDLTMARRPLPKGPDGEDEYLYDEERNIPVRVYGATQMMSREEWEAWRAEHQDKQA